MSTRHALFRRPRHPGATATRRAVLVLGALVGVWLGCARATPREGVWFDACCGKCSAGYCEDCNQSKAACGEGQHDAECMVDDGVMMCRPGPT